jgi:hypothetical protein
MTVPAPTVPAPTVPAPTAPADAALADRFARAQVLALARTASLDEVVAVQAAARATDAAVRLAATDLAAARVLIATRAQRVLPPGADPAAVLVLRSLHDPALALIRWRSGDTAGARALLENALLATGRLMAEHGHDHLTVRRLHLARNVARLLSPAEGPDAGARCEALLRVAAGERGCWPHTHAGVLRVPLDGLEREVVVAQLERLRATRR